MASKRESLKLENPLAEEALSPFQISHLKNNKRDMI